MEMIDYFDLDLAVEFRWATMSAYSSSLGFSSSIPMKAA